MPAVNDQNIWVELGDDVGEEVVYIIFPVGKDITRPGETTCLFLEELAGRASALVVLLLLCFYICFPCRWWWWWWSSY